MRVSYSRVIYNQIAISSFVIILLQCKKCFLFFILYVLVHEISFLLEMTSDFPIKCCYLKCFIYSLFFLPSSSFPHMFLIDLFICILSISIHVSTCRFQLTSVASKTFQSSITRRCILCVFNNVICCRDSVLIVLSFSPDVFPCSFVGHFIMMIIIATIFASIIFPIFWRDFFALF